MRTTTLQVVCAMALVLAAGPWALAERATQVKARTASPGQTAAPAKTARTGPRCDVLFQVHVPAFAEEIIAKIQEGIDKELSGKKFGESSKDFAIRKVLVRTLGKGIVQAVRQTDNVSIGWKLDRKAKRTYVDLMATALPGTPLAARFAQAKTLKTSFAGFKMPGAALSANWVGQATAEEAAAWAKIVQMVRDRMLPLAETPGLTPEASKTRKELLSKLFEVVAVTVATGRSDGAMSLVIHPDRVTLVAGGYVADGARLESVVKPVAKYLSERHEVLADLKLDAARFQGVNLHTLAIPAPTNTDRARFVRMFGKSLDIVLGFGPQAAYLAVGKDAMASLKKAIRRSAKPRVPANPFEITLALKPVADFITAVGKPHERIPAGFVSSALSKAPGKDRLRLIVRPVERGVIVRFVAEQGVLELIGALSPKARRFLLRE